METIAIRHRPAEEKGVFSIDQYKTNFHVVKQPDIKETKMRKKLGFIVWAQLALLLNVGFALIAQQEQEKDVPPASPKQLWERLQRTLPPFSYTIQKDEIVQSDSDPRQNMRRIEARFISQKIDGVRMGQTAVIFIPAGNSGNLRPEQRGKVVIVTHSFDDVNIELNYAEPIAARTGYPTMSLQMPGDDDGADGERDWLLFFRKLARDTQDPFNHDLFRCAVPYIQALDVFSDLLKEKDIRAVIGGHSARAYYAYTAAAMDPERIAGVVYMGCERLFTNDVTYADTSIVASFSDDQVYPKSLIPFYIQRYVKCPVFYIGVTNEGAYAMFNINKFQEKMKQKWTMEYIPNHIHDARSEKQFIDWRMWVSHIFDGRPITQVHDLSFEEDEEGTFFRARIDSENKIIQVKAWYVHNHDDPFWRDLMWFPVNMKKKQGNLYEAYVSGWLPDAWLVEVQDTANGFPGYISSLPQDITQRPVKLRNPRYGHDWRPKRKKD